MLRFCTHEARILSRHFVTAQCPDKKAGAAGLPNSSQAILSHILSQTRAKEMKGKHEDSIFYVIDKEQSERCGDAAQALYIIK